MVIGQPHTLRQRIARKRSQFVGIGLPGGFAGEARALVQRYRRPLNRIGDFTVDHDLGTIGGQQSQVGADGFDFFFGGAARQSAGIPARHAVELIFAEHRPQGFRLLGEFVAQLKAAIADLCAFGQGYVERSFAAQ